MNPQAYAQVKKLFMQALERPIGKQREFLEDACDDPEIRAEVFALLRNHTQRTLLTKAAVAETTALSDLATDPKKPNLLRRAQTKAQTFVPRDNRFRAVLVAGSMLLALLVSFWLYSGVQSSLREMRSQQLETLVDAEQAALTHWLDGQKSKVASWARDPEFRAAVHDLTELAMKDDADLSIATAQKTIYSYLRNIAGEDVEFSVWNRSYDTIADGTTGSEEQHSECLGEGVTDQGAVILNRVFDRRPVIQMPHFGEFVRRSGDDEGGAGGSRNPSPEGTGERANSDEDSEEESGAAKKPHMSVIVPVESPEGGGLIAALLIRSSELDDEFNAIFLKARAESSGETYAFNESGVMISESRFNAQLRRIGLIDSAPESFSRLVVQIRDPGGNLTEGYTSDLPVGARNLTRMAALATTHKDGWDVDGYRDYRGVPVIGAWRWLDGYDFGITTEIDLAEAYAPLWYLKFAFGSIGGMLTLTVGLLTMSSGRIAELQQEVEEAQAMDEQQLGPYSLDHLIGQGGMGSVYLARHALLKRPTAVKILDPDQANAKTLGWFEREVQHASQLSHPNTIQIYDYGHTPTGVFYYAMEYIDGVTLVDLLRLEGALPPARVVHLIRQVCLSLREAHAQKLIHRDIKPHNIMVCRRGCQGDVIKVLDFGLVKDASEDTLPRLTSTGAFAGTPLYMSPERLRDPLNVDTRADIYAIGAVAFELLAARPVFLGTAPADVIDEAMNEEPERVSQIAPRRVPPELDERIHPCLANKPEDRPATVEQLLPKLGRAP
ncbi:MAG: serine/threonine protein kinase, partial [Planctomycetes bacterium]|nr:serine/threonine protein kinase [Planctomycetota bacterium]